MGEIERIAVIGCGGVGGVAAALLADAGRDVTGVTNNDAITCAIREEGLYAQVDDRFLNTKIDAHTQLDSGVEPFDLVLVAVPPNASVAAVEGVLPFLKSDGLVVTLPNGLVEEHVAPIAGDERVLGGIVSYGAAMNAPGRVRRTAPGGLTIGRLDGSEDDAVDRVARALAPVGEIKLTTNLRGARWSKLAINCAISSLGTVGGDRLGALMRHRYVRRLALETMTEVVAVAHAENVHLEKVSGTLDLDWMAMSDDERLRSASASLLAKHTVLLAVGTKFRNMRSSMLSQIERGRTPPVDFLNGEITSRGEAFGIETPINRALQETVHAIARGESSSSMATLKGLYERTRTDVRDALSA